jgi:hypothetical protein
VHAALPLNKHAFEVRRGVDSQQHSSASRIQVLMTRIPGHQGSVSANLPNWHGTHMPGSDSKPAVGFTTSVLGLLHPANCIDSIAE